MSVREPPLLVLAALVGLRGPRVALSGVQICAARRRRKGVPIVSSRAATARPTRGPATRATNLPHLRPPPLPTIPYPRGVALLVWTGTCATDATTTWTTSSSTSSLLTHE